MKHKVSVVIPTYNFAQYITEAIISILNQTYKNIEIVVVDDGSTDDTKDVLKPLSDRIKYIYQENSGPSRARNTGILNSSGGYIAFLDADDFWEPTKLEKQLNLFEDDHKTSLVFCFIKHVDVNRNILFIDEYDDGWNGYVVDRLLHRPIGTSSVLINRKYLQQVGLFDEDLLFSEDRDMFLRLAKNFKFNLVPEALVIKRAHSQSLTHDTSKSARYIDDETHALDKFYTDIENRKKYGHVRNKAYFNIYLRRGNSHLQGDISMKLARKYFMKALLYNPIAIELYYKILQSCLDKRMYIILRNLKGTLSKS